MTMDRFKALLETYGADPARWPAGERDDALRFLAASEEARTERDEAAILDLSARIRRAQSTVPATPEAHAAVTATITAIKHAGRRAPLTPELLDQVAHDLIGGTAPAP